ncbi:HAMP domain-containing protein [Saccharothrix sp. ST-888]|uniref:HAMP domain-containing protein n=1 Tax=Saccharothrix sp. ST-888 TaxID=1427391 RepID=UPI0018CE8B98|nr:HAMP domain-containing protein [Saccharothrix sp. ST-888]
MLAVQVNMSPELYGLHRLDVSMAAASLLSLAAAVPLAVCGAGLISRRLRRVSETAGRISAGDLDARTGPTKGRDEVADIAATVDLMADSLGRRLRTERQFTADVAHELRTPVGGLLAAADLLPPGETEDLLRARVRDLRGLIEDLLEISRLDAGAEQPVQARVPLGAVVCEAVARTGLDASVTAADAQHAAAAGTVETDPHRHDRHRPGRRAAGGRHLRGADGDRRHGLRPVHRRPGPGDLRCRPRHRERRDEARPGQRLPE